MLPRLKTASKYARIAASQSSKTQRDTSPTMTTITAIIDGLPKSMEPKTNRRNRQMNTLKDILIIALLVALLWFVVIEPRLDPTPIAQTAPYIIQAIQPQDAAQLHDPVNVLAELTRAVMEAPQVIATATNGPTLNEVIGQPNGLNAFVNTPMP
jgi:hypothetical protein